MKHRKPAKVPYIFNYCFANMPKLNQACLAKPNTMKSSLSLLNCKPSRRYFWPVYTNAQCKRGDC